ncbi:MAG: ABC transporter ATP-binding protein [Chloroflexi bacterium]|jgi:putative ABC transport system ATP-binding protein|nr:ABC transporter ATP-binding protein [Chloroflexota bacterium]MBK6712849.1 ABC transporter ATP-binding protein [Chloroflexota bacterium]MBK7177547.1 ABC transporter ATP-binding protein [Chloroflexota bacterium]MBK7918765.1 ABC transporter ATP-binding protein [Chloroflexota bacterium]MBK8931841.1 ABC transporter ATP-binding protein [Chloroflexota bacterium]
MKSTLATKNITKEYHIDESTIKAVDDVSIELFPGEFVALVGPSGSGKTSMLAMIAGLLSPTSGQIMLGGEEISQMSESQLTAFRRRKIGFTFQSNNLVPFLSVRENVELMLRLNGRYDKDGRQRAADLLERLGLGERMNNLPSQLSGGQKQRVAIARSLIHDPDLVLADEPTASLDTTLAYQVVETFSELIHEQNRIGIMVTHDLRMCRYVDRVIQMMDGKLEGIISDRQEIEALAGLDTHSFRPTTAGDNGIIKPNSSVQVPTGIIAPAMAA